MKTINVTFEDEEFEHLLQQKQNTKWSRYILEMACYPLLKKEVNGPN